MDNTSDVSSSGWTTVLGLSMLVALSGCGGSSPGSSPSPDTAPWTPTESDTGTRPDAANDGPPDAGSVDGDNGTTGQPDATGTTDANASDTDPTTDVHEREVQDHRARVRKALRAREWAVTSVGSHGTSVRWHHWASEGRLQRVDTWRRPAHGDGGADHDHHLPDPTHRTGTYQVLPNGAVDWTVPSSTSDADPPAERRLLETFVGVREEYGFVELSSHDRVVKGIDRVWAQGGLRAQNDDHTRFHGVTAEYRDNYHDDETWNDIQRIERTVTFDRGTDDCQFDLDLSVTVKYGGETKRTAHESFDDLSCTIPTEDGPEYRIVVDRFADRQMELDDAWRVFLQNRGLDDKYDGDLGDAVFRAFARGFVPAFRADQTRPDVLLMGRKVAPRMVGTQTDGPSLTDTD